LFGPSALESYFFCTAVVDAEAAAQLKRSMRLRQLEAKQPHQKRLHRCALIADAL
jgi:hypothetical protein